MKVQKLFFSFIYFISTLFYNLSYADDFFDDEVEFMSSISTGRNVLASKSASIVSVLDKKYFSDYGVKYVEDAISTIPGIYLAKNTLGQSHSYICRGISSKSNAEVLFMIDNNPIKTVSQGNILSGSWVNMSLDYVEKIEVIRGSGSAVYGADAFSCVINITTNKNDSTLSTSLASYETNKFYFSNTNKFIIKDFNLNYGILNEKSDGYNGNIDYDIQSFIDSLTMTSASLAPNNGNFSYNSYDYFINFYNDNLKIAYLKQIRTDIGVGNGFNGSIDHDGSYKSSRNLLNFSYTINPSNNIKTTFKYSNFNFQETVIKPLMLNPVGFSQCFDCPVYLEGFQASPELFEDTTSYSIDNFFYNFEKHIIRLGFGYNKYSIYKTKDTNNATGIFISFDDTDFIFTPEKSRNNSFIYIQDEFDITNDIIITSGARYDNYNDFGGTLNPRFSVVWNYDEYITHKFIYNKAFRAPTIGELYSKSNPIAEGNEDLTAEKINSFEYSFSYNNHDNFQFLNNIYYYKITDDIQFIPQDGVVKAFNDGIFEGFGMENEIHYNYGNIKISPKFSYQYSYDLTNNEIMHYYPQKMFQLSILHKISNKLKYNISANYNSEQKYISKYFDGFSLNNKNETIKNPFIFKFNISYVYNDINFDFILNNIFNKTIYDPYISNNKNLPDLKLPVSERNFSVSITYKL